MGRDTEGEPPLAPGGRSPARRGGRRRGGERGQAPAILVTISYIELARTTIPVVSETRFGVRVISDASAFRWRFAGRTGVGKPGLLVLQAPRAGRYLLFVEANEHGARARVVVRPR